jgi:hypothetical protein
MTCLSIIESNSGARTGRSTGPSARFAGYDPADLLKAYQLTAAAARPEHGKTVAIVDAFNDPRAAFDLARYRKKFNLPACTVASGCLRIVNQKGSAKPLPKADSNWATEESLDLDMVSAICPRCHILMVEANSAETTDLGAAVDRAVAMGAKYVSDSWGGPENLFTDPFDHFFNHPGVAVNFASGDGGYGVNYPADLQYVTSVGGTSLKRTSSGRGFTESVWGSPGSGEGTASGCSGDEAKPSWQRVDDTEPSGCLNRTENDVAAVADPRTGVFIIDSFEQPGHLVVGGTSAASPIITSIYALAGTPTPRTYPAQYPYLHSQHLFPVTKGSNGPCEPSRQYLCTAGPGYDGPTGLGTPDGTSAFTNNGAHRITVVDPGTADAAAGDSLSLPITAFDTSTAAASALQFTATGLPSSLTIRRVPHSTNALITGTLPSTPGAFHVTVNAHDGKTAGTTHFEIAVLPSLTAAGGTPGEIGLTEGTVQAVACLDAGSGGTGATVKVMSCDSGSSGQQWLFTSDGRPDDSGQLTVGGSCLSLPSASGQAVLATCDGGVSQRWQWQENSQFRNVSTGTCLTGHGVGAAVGGLACLTTSEQTWVMPAGQILSGAGQPGAGLCLDGSGNAKTGTTPATVSDCANSTGQQWTLFFEVMSANGLCLTATSPLPETPVVLSKCQKPGQDWRPYRNGELTNVNDGLCLDDPADGGAGTALIQRDCYGEPGEIWGLN